MGIIVSSHKVNIDPQEFFERVEKMQKCIHGIEYYTNEFKKAKQEFDDMMGKGEYTHE